MDSTDRSVPAAVGGTLERAPVAELLGLMATLLGEDQVNARAARYRTWQRDPHRAHTMAMAAQAERLDALLAGLLSAGAGGVTENGIAWAVEHARQRIAELETVDGGDVVKTVETTDTAETAEAGARS